MLSRAASAVAPLYLFICLILGGSDHASWHDAVLDIAGLLIIAWAAAAPAAVPLTRAARQFLFLSIVAVTIMALQEMRFVALPWGHGLGLPLAERYGVEQPGPWYRVFFTPPHLLSASLALVPPLAAYCAVVRFGRARGASLVIALVAGAFVAIVASAVQFGAVAGSPGYPGHESSSRFLIGHFTNPDHLADLVIITLPFIAVIAPSAKAKEAERYSGLLLISAALALLMISGLALTGSLAGFVLAVPVIAASAFLVMPLRSRLRKPTALLAALLAFAAIATLSAGEQIGDRLGLAPNSSIEPRRAPLPIMAKAIADHMPWGSGLGSFPRVYPFYDKSRAARSTDLTHARDDYAEFALELGLPGIALILLFLTWWGTAVRSAWRKETGMWLSRAASVASAMILVDSLFDFPLRTAAISACLGACIALLAGHCLPPRAKPADLRAARHLVFE